MRRIIWFNMVTLDGFFEGPDRDITWHNVDEEFNDFAAEQLDSLDTLLFGRITYEMMASYWPSDMAIHDDPVIAGKMNSIAKVVYSTSLDSAGWENSTLIKMDIIEATERMKDQRGKDMAIFGSGILGNALLDAGLIDEIRLMVNPVVLRQGRPLFHDGLGKLDLTLCTSRSFANGNVLLTYEPVTVGERV